jgi:hypothetical protein
MQKPQEPSHVPTQQQFNVADVPITNPHNVEPVYCNNAAVYITQWDIRLLFSEITVDVKLTPGHVVRASVTMTPKHAKAFLSVLQNTIEVYEKDNGKL